MLPDGMFKKVKWKREFLARYAQAAGGMGADVPGGQSKALPQAAGIRFETP